MYLSGIVWLCQFVVYDLFRHSDSSPIVGGHVVEKNEISRYSFTASLQDRLQLANGTVEFRHFCGGSLISSLWILTAGHCVYFKNETQIVAAIGYADLKASNMGYREIDNITLMDFVPLSLKNDIALVRLKDPFASDGDISFGRLPDLGMSTRARNPCTVIGYGAEKYGGESTEVLKEAEVYIISRSTCTRILGKIIAPQEGDSSFCGLGDLQDSCQGDSGSPLICTVHKKSYIFGIVSHGLTCGQSGVPSIYTATAAYKSRIERVIKDDM